MRMNILQDLTLHLAKGCALSAAEVSAALTALLTPEVADIAKAEFLTALAAKGETAEEIAAFARELRSRAVDPVFHTTKLLEMSSDLSYVIEIVDKDEKIQAFLPELDQLMLESHGSGLVTLEHVQVLQYGPVSQ